MGREGGESVCREADPDSIVLDGDSREADRLVVEGPPSPRLHLLLMSGRHAGERDAGHRGDRVAAMHAALEAERVVHLTVQRDRGSIWVGGCGHGL